MKRLLRFCLIAWLAAAGAARADLVLSRSHTWDLGSHGWTNEFGYTSLERELAGGNPDGWLEITFPVTAVPEIFEFEWYDVVHVSPDNLLITPTTEMGIKFDFLAQTRLPQDMQLQFHAQSGNIWGYNLTSQVTQTQSWTRVGADLRYSDGWGGLPGFDDTLDQFVSDLASLDWIGVYIWRDEASQETYGIDNFHFVIPEPEEYAMLAMALITSVLALRKRQTPIYAEASVG